MVACVLISLVVMTVLICWTVANELDICDNEADSLNYLSKSGDSLDVYIRWPESSKVSHSCHATFQTCDHCHIKVYAVEPRFHYPDCWRASGTEEKCALDCVYFFLFDTNYKSQRQKRVSNSHVANIFESLSKRLQVVACGNHVQSANISMKLRLIAAEKTQHIAGNTPVSQHSLTSPFFPDPYVRNNELFVYKFEGSLPGERIAITFDDWMLSPYSTIWFEGSYTVNRINGNHARPFITSSNHIMTMTFSTGEPGRSANNLSFPGFKAVATFYKNGQLVPKIENGCDRWVTTSEGGILHLYSAADGQNRDCIWVIKKVAGFDGVYLRVLRYSTRSEPLDSCDYSLEVRGGLFSTSDQRLKIMPNERVLNYAFQLSDEGFYIRIHGCYVDDAVVISYAMYLNDCDDYRDYYKCDNGKCIPEHLRCDTFDHCGDRSDELPGMCGRVSPKIKTVSAEFSSSNVRSSNSNGYDYYLIYVVIPLVASVILVIGTMCALVLLVRRCRRLTTTIRQVENSSTNQDQAQRNRGRRRCWPSRGVQMSVTMTSGEHPPSYDDVVRSTPIGYLNMALSWSSCRSAFSQLPTYEEAMSPASTSHPEPEADTTHSNSTTPPPREPSSTLTASAAPSDMTSAAASPSGAQSESNWSSPSMPTEDQSHLGMPARAKSSPLIHVKRCNITIAAPQPDCCNISLAAPQPNGCSNISCKLQPIDQMSGDVLSSIAAHVLSTRPKCWNHRDRNTESSMENSQINESTFSRQKNHGRFPKPEVCKDSNCFNAKDGDDHMSGLDTDVNDFFADVTTSERAHQRVNHSPCSNGSHLRSQSDRTQDWLLQSGPRSSTLMNDGKGEGGSGTNPINGSSKAESGHNGTCLNYHKRSLGHNSRSVSCSDILLLEGSPPDNVNRRCAGRDKRFSYAGAGDLSVHNLKWQKAGGCHGYKRGHYSHWMDSDNIHVSNNVSTQTGQVLLPRSADTDSGVCVLTNRQNESHSEIKEVSRHIRDGNKVVARSKPADRGVRGHPESNVENLSHRVRKMDALEEDEKEVIDRL